MGGEKKLQFCREHIVVCEVVGELEMAQYSQDERAKKSPHIFMNVS